MRIGSIVRFTGVLVVTLSLAACASTGRTLVTHEKTQPIPAGKTVALMVAPADGISVPAYLDAANRIQQQLPLRLELDQIFKSVVEAAESADYDAEVIVLEVTETSPGARVMLGFMAPRSSVRVGVELRDRAKDQVIVAFEATGFGSRSWMSAQGYGVDDPVREAIEQIITNLR